MVICLKLLVLTRNIEEKAVAGLRTEKQPDAPYRSVTRKMSTSMALCKQTLSR